jgi:hypothetical protein
MSETPGNSQGPDATYFFDEEDANVEPPENTGNSAYWAKMPMETKVGEHRQVL